MKHKSLSIFIGITVLFFILSPVYTYALPYVTEQNPASNETQVPIDTNVTFHIKDGSADISLSSIKVTIQREGDEFSTTIIENGLSAVTGAAIDAADVRNVIVTYDPPDDDAHRFSFDQLIIVAIEAGGVEYQYSFTTASIIQAPNILVNHTKTGDQLNSRMVLDNSGNDVYVVWQDQDGQIWFSSSQDRGETFADEIRISADNSGSNQNPAISVDEPGNIYVIWESKKDQQNSELYFCRKLKNDKDFETYIIPIDVILGIDSDQQFPAIQAKNNGPVFIVWVNSNSVNEGLYFSRSNDHGESFRNIKLSDISRVDDATETLPKYPDIGIDSSGHNEIFTWSALKNNKRNIYFNAFEYDPSNKVDVKVYPDDFQVNDVSIGDSCDKPRIANRNNFSGGGKKSGIAIVWENTRGADIDIFLDKSGDGSSWGTDVRVNTDEIAIPALQQEPQVAMDSNGDIFCAWSDKRSGNWDIYAAYSFDGARTFKEEIKLNDDNSNGDQVDPSLYLSANGKNFCATWTDRRNAADSDIYFGRNTIFDEEHCSLARKDSDTTAQADPSSSIANTQVVIPVLALEADTSISVARVYCPPGFIFGKTNLKKFVHFGPSGTKFKNNVTISIPYASSDLIQAGLASDSALTIYYYNPKMKAWELVPGTTQDYLRQVVSANVNHFSTYALAEGASNSSGGGGGGGGCFIATAAFGSSESAEVKTLRVFRDHYLLSNPLGKKFVKFYYAHSPSLASYIKDKPALKAIVRLALKPVVYCVSKLR